MKNEIPARRRLLLMQHDIHNISTRVGVMKRGRWFPADELEAALEQLADERK